MSGRAETLGLTDPEIDWLRANAETHEGARKLISQYQMVVVCSRDPGARGIFEAMLNDARKDFLEGVE